METVAEVIEWFASRGMSATQRIDHRSGLPAAYVGKLTTSGEVNVLENAVFVYRTASSTWRIERYYFGGSAEEAEAETADTAAQIALAMVATGQWPASVAVRKF